MSRPQGELPATDGRQPGARIGNVATRKAGPTTQHGSGAQAQGEGRAKRSVARTGQADMASFRTCVR